MHVGVGDIRKSQGLSKSFVWNDPYKLKGIELSGPLHLDLKITNAASRIMVTGPLRTSVTLNCSRCLEDFSFAAEVELEEEFLPSDSPEARTRANDLLDGTFTFEDDKIVLDELLRQEIEAATPIQVLCKPDCKGLCGDCGANLNVEPCRCEPEEALSPIAAALKDLPAAAGSKKKKKK